MYLASRGVHVEDFEPDDRDYDERRQLNYSRTMRAKCWKTPDCGCPVCEPHEDEPDELDE